MLTGMLDKMAAAAEALTPNGRPQLPVWGVVTLSRAIALVLLAIGDLVKLVDIPVGFSDG